MGGEQAPSWEDGYEEDGILLPDPEIHPLLQIGFLLSHELVVRDDVVGFHGETVAGRGSKVAGHGRKRHGHPIFRESRPDWPDLQRTL